MRHHLQTLFSIGVPSSLTDGQLLERFATTTGEAADLAFATLVERHAAMVFHACRGILHDEHEAFDAFQATFLVLLRKRDSLWVRDSLGPWLHRVACRASARARAQARRRIEGERLAARGIESRPGGEADDGRIAILHEEIDRLPERYRVPIVLCDLQGRTYAEAAQHLRRPIGTVRSRISRGREQLRHRLARRGLNSGAVGALVDFTGVARLEVPTALIRLAVARAGGGEGPATALLLADELIRSTLMSRVKVAAIGLTLTVAAAGVVAGRDHLGDKPAVAKGGRRGIGNIVALAPIPDGKAQPAVQSPTKTGPGIAGMVLDAKGKPVEGARILFGQADNGFQFEEGATATADANGHYCVDLAGFPWSSGAMKAIALVPGFEAAERTLPANAAEKTLDFDLKPKPWKEMKIRLEDVSGRQVGGVEVVCKVGGFTWARLKSGADGACQLAMAPELWISLNASPEGARPIEASIDVSQAGIGSVVLPVIPPYRGRVLDAEGRPLAGAVVGDGWIAHLPNGEKRMAPFYREAVTTDRDGRFAIATVLKVFDRAKLFGPPSVETLSFADKDFRRIALRPVEPSKANELIEVRLATPRQVRISVSPGSVKPTENASLDIQLQIVPQPEKPDRRFYFLTNEQQPWKAKPNGQGVNEVIEKWLPEGTYHLDLVMRNEKADKTIGSAKHEFVVSNGEGILELPPVTLGPTAHDQMLGKPAPEIDATELDTGRSVKLADYRGRVVVLDFWGYWCGPCIWNMPRLVELQRKFAGRPLTILAMHDQSVQSRAAYDAKFAAVRQRIWGGRDLPFPVLFDRPDPTKAEDSDPEGSGTTISRYEISGFPTLIVIDANGTLVDQVWFTDHDRLETLVRGLLEKAERR